MMYTSQELMIYDIGYKTLGAPTPMCNSCNSETIDC